LCAYNIFEGGARGAQGESLREVRHEVITSQQQIVYHYHFQKSYSFFESYSEYDAAAILVHRALRRSHAGSETMSLRAQEIAMV
jgi:hypothetical protein